MIYFTYILNETATGWYQPQPLGNAGEERVKNIFQVEQYSMIGSSTVPLDEVFSEEILKANEIVEISEDAALKLAPSLDEAGFSKDGRIIDVAKYPEHKK